MANEDETLGDFNQTTQDCETVSKPAASEDANLGSRIGPYRVERLLARGGMGAVYLATRQDDFEQRVALKLVHPDLQNTEVLRRFAAERQILAGLEHPNIARIFDGGTTRDALPYFVMEYVEGVPLDRYCNDHNFNVEQRLELFRQVCVAVHFAHQNLVVHRDLKPSNILVTAEGVPKLLDFGIAKLLAFSDEREARVSTEGERGGFRASAPLETEGRGGPLTPAFASPEQLLGEKITTASDVYSLGVLLYQVMSGQPPYRLGEVARAEWVDLICQRDPTRPSLMVRTRGAGRRLERRLEGDIDAIVLKAMQKEPRQRYASALQLAEDIRRHLTNLPTEAHPGGWRYRSRKFARRHKLALATACLLLFFSVAMTFLWRQAVDQRAAAERSQERAEAVSSFLEDLFESVDPEAAQGEAVTIRQALDQGREKLATELLDEPEIRADLLATLGTTYQSLGFYEEARELKEEALRTRRSAVPEDVHGLAIDFNNLGRLFYDWGDFASAEMHYQQALVRWEELGDNAHVALVLRNLAALEMQRGEAERALKIYRRALELDRQLYGDEDPRIAASLYGLGARYRLAGDPYRAEPLLRQALAIYQKSPDAEQLKVASVESSLAQALHSQGRLEEAREFLERALLVQRRLLGDDHVLVASRERHLAALLLEFGEIEAAGAILEGALFILRRERRAGDWRIADAESVWGSYLVATGRDAEAESILQASLTTLLEAKGKKDVRAVAARRRLAALYEARGDIQKAAELSPRP